MKKKIALLLILISAAILIFAGVHVFQWWMDNSKTDEMVKDITVKAQPSENTINFKALKDINSDTAGWVRVNGTQIDYPYVKTTDNDYYLSHTFDKSESRAGWVFMDYRNSKSSWGRNNILYAHGRVDGTMFGSLREVLKEEWQTNKSNHYVQTLRQAGNNKWQVFSVYKVATTDDYIKVDFASDGEYEEFLRTISERSEYSFGVSVTKKDKILTLSTCYDDTEKAVLHAKLVE